ncbi:hypothetical protein QAD02_006755 [Eretmocerus hayati]|uniref:Uncharacterized protein n=1 Tax=Eretmocerus hayati TaxID=131215 RepID=A0ACC2N1T0_9HYME|nr:hypothetical protein QAD02_006755 [Eretmocerus hayati]
MAKCDASLDRRSKPRGDQNVSVLKLIGEKLCINGFMYSRTHSKIGNRANWKCIERYRRENNRVKCHARAVTSDPFTSEWIILYEGLEESGHNHEPNPQDVKEAEATVLGILMDPCTDEKPDSNLKTCATKVQEPISPRKAENVEALDKLMDSDSETKQMVQSTTIGGTPNPGGNSRVKRRGPLEDHEVYRQFLAKFAKDPIFGRQRMIEALKIIYSSKQGCLMAYATVLEYIYREEIERDLENLRNNPTVQIFAVNSNKADSSQNDSVEPNHGVLTYPNSDNSRTVETVLTDENATKRISGKDSEQKEHPSPHQGNDADIIPPVPAALPIKDLLSSGASLFNCNRGQPRVKGEIICIDLTNESDKNMKSEPELSINDKTKPLSNQTEQVAYAQRISAPSVQNVGLNITQDSESPLSNLLRDIDSLGPNAPSHCQIHPAMTSNFMCPLYDSVMCQPWNYSLGSYSNLSFQSTAYDVQAYALDKENLGLNRPTVEDISHLPASDSSYKARNPHCKLEQMDAKTIGSRLCIDGFLFITSHIDNVNDKVHWKCRRSCRGNCLAQAISSKPMNGREIIVYKKPKESEHNHPPSPNEVNAAEIAAKLEEAEDCGTLLSSQPSASDCGSSSSGETYNKMDQQVSVLSDTANAMEIDEIDLESRLRSLVRSTTSRATHNSLGYASSPTPPRIIGNRLNIDKFVYIKVNSCINDGVTQIQWQCQRYRTGECYATATTSNSEFGQELIVYEGPDESKHNHSPILTDVEEAEEEAKCSLVKNQSEMNVSKESIDDTHSVCAISSTNLVPELSETREVEEIKNSELLHSNDAEEPSSESPSSNRNPSPAFAWLIGNKLCIDGFIYIKVNSNRKRLYWQCMRCTLGKCNAIAVTSKPSEDQGIVVYKGPFESSHDHPVIDADVEEAEAKTKCIPGGNKTESEITTRSVSKPVLGTARPVPRMIPEVVGFDDNEESNGSKRMKLDENNQSYAREDSNGDHAHQDEMTARLIGKRLYVNGYMYSKHANGPVTTWICRSYRNTGCTVKVFTSDPVSKKKLTVYSENELPDHNHPPSELEVERAELVAQLHRNRSELARLQDNPNSDVANDENDENRAQTGHRSISNKKIAVVTRPESNQPSRQRVTEEPHPSSSKKISRSSNSMRFIGNRLCIDGFVYMRSSRYHGKIRWECQRYRKTGCTGAVNTSDSSLIEKLVVYKISEHNHLSGVTEVKAAEDFARYGHKKQTPKSEVDDQTVGRLVPGCGQVPPKRRRSPSPAEADMSEELPRRSQRATRGTIHVSKTKNRLPGERKHHTSKGNALVNDDDMYRKFLVTFLKKPIFDRDNVVRALTVVYKSYQGRHMGHGIILENREKIEQDLETLRVNPNASITVPIHSPGANSTGTSHVAENKDDENVLKPKKAEVTTLSGSKIQLTTDTSGAQMPPPPNQEVETNSIPPIPAIVTNGDVASSKTPSLTLSQEEPQIKREIYFIDLTDDFDEIKTIKQEPHSTNEMTFQSDQTKATMDTRVNPPPIMQNPHLGYYPQHFHANQFMVPPNFMYPYCNPGPMYPPPFDHNMENPNIGESVNNMQHCFHCRSVVLIKRPFSFDMASHKNSSLLPAQDVHSGIPLNLHANQDVTAVKMIGSRLFINGFLFVKTQTDSSNRVHWQCRRYSTDCCQAKAITSNTGKSKKIILHKELVDDSILHNHLPNYKEVQTAEEIARFEQMEKYESLSINQANIINESGTFSRNQCKTEIQESNSIKIPGNGKSIKSVTKSEPKLQVPFTAMEATNKLVKTIGTALCINGYTYSKTGSNSDSSKVYWQCKRYKKGCYATAITSHPSSGEKLTVHKGLDESKHNHPPIAKDLKRAEEAALCRFKKDESIKRHNAPPTTCNHAIMGTHNGSASNPSASSQIPMEVTRSRKINNELHNPKKIRIDGEDRQSSPPVSKIRDNIAKSRLIEDELIIRGYIYIKPNFKSDRVSWVCKEYRKKGCLGRANTSPPSKGEDLVIYRGPESSKHNHAPNLGKMKEAKEMKFGCKQEPEESAIHTRLHSEKDQSILNHDDSSGPAEVENIEPRRSQRSLAIIARTPVKTKRRRRAKPKDLLKDDQTYRKFLVKFLKKPLFDERSVVQALKVVYISSQSRRKAYSKVLDHREKIEKDLKALRKDFNTDVTAPSNCSNQTSSTVKNKAIGKGGDYEELSEDKFDIAISDSPIMEAAKDSSEVQEHPPPHQDKTINENISSVPTTVAIADSSFSEVTSSTSSSTSNQEELVIKQEIKLVDLTNDVNKNLKLEQERSNNGDTTSQLHQPYVFIKIFLASK